MDILFLIVQALSGSRSTLRFATTEALLLFAVKALILCLYFL